jgi:hypothetical protein
MQALAMLLSLVGMAVAAFDTGQLVSMGEFLGVCVGVAG